MVGRDITAKIHLAFSSPFAPFLVHRPTKILTLAITNTITITIKRAYEKAQYRIGTLQALPHSFSLSVKVK